jgi:FKBP-type peptidyl-prolyl cis-trans isomerase FkpA/FKBP-type peptidyl-prolyl cis-trans isomerase FklB
MKIIFRACLILAIVTACSPKKPESDIDKASYFVGQQIGQNMRRQNLRLNRGVIMQGMSDALNEKEGALTPEEMQAAQQLFNRLVNEKVQEMSKANMKSAEDFLEANKKNPGWVTTASGLQYKVLKAGKGRKPKAHDTVLVHYVGTLHDGTKFDSSRDRGKPSELKVDGVLKGWSEALQLMPEGSHWVLLLPAALGYGASGAGPIPPHSVLMFDVELIKVK